MEIRANSKDIKKLRDYRIPEKWTLTEDHSLDSPVIMIHADGKMIPWAKGLDQVESFLKYGYIREIKKCPLRTFGKCRAERCAWYVIHNERGHCVKVWSFHKG